LISGIYLILSLHISTPPSINTNIIDVQSKFDHIKPRAYVITADCRSPRFNVTKQNIERAFPDFFNVLCHLTIPLNDSRIHTSTVMLQRKFSSNLLAFVHLWTYKIPDQSQNPYEWSFIFEDDVNFIQAEKVLLPNFIASMKEFMYTPEIHMKDGFFYLGICGPTYPNDSQIIISRNSKIALYSEKGYGYCLHASAITAKRARLFWTEISSYRPNPTESSLDYQVRMYSNRSRNFFYTFGTSFHHPPKTGHYGIAYQDRGIFSTTVADEELS
jgi:hypothetical protein